MCYRRHSRCPSCASGTLSRMMRHASYTMVEGSNCIVLMTLPTPILSDSATMTAPLCLSRCYTCKDKKKRQKEMFKITRDIITALFHWTKQHILTYPITHDPTFWCSCIKFTSLFLWSSVVKRFLNLANKLNVTFPFH